jgi:flagellar hook-associated protein 3 FlgL
MSTIGRISTAESYRGGIQSIADAQALLNRFQDQLATGKRILQPADDPVSASQVIGLKNSLARLEDYQANTNRAAATLAFQEDAVAGVEDVLFRARELIIRSQNPVLNAEDRVPLAAEVEGLFDQLLALGNTQNADGEFIFGGNASRSQPYVYDNVADVVTATSFGDLGNRELNIADGIRIRVSDPGTEVFYAAPGNGTFTVAADPTNTGRSIISSTRADANFDETQDYTLTFTETSPGSFTWEVTGSVSGTYTGTFSEGVEIEFGLPGQQGAVKVSGLPSNGDTYQITSNNGAETNVFDVLLNVRRALESSGNVADRAKSDTALNQALQTLDQNLTRLSVVRTDIGVRLNRVEDQANLNSAFNLQLQETVSSLEDVDYAETISNLQLQLVALQAAQQTFVKTTGLTIFNYL